MNTATSRLMVSIRKRSCDSLLRPEAPTSANFFAVSVTMSIRRCCLVCSSGMFRALEAALLLAVLRRRVLLT
jgi:hypothetical protein